MEEEFDWLGGLQALQGRFPALVEDEYVKTALAEVRILKLVCL